MRSVHEMLWPTNSQKQLFDNNMDSMELHLNLVSNLLIFLQYRVLALCTQRAITGRLLEVYLGLTLKHLTRKERLGQKKTLTCEIDLEFFHASSILVIGLASVLSSLVQTDGCSVCCIYQYCGVPYQCCVYGRSSSG